MPTRLFIHATNVHQGGGKSLLYALLERLPENIGLIVLLDTRMKVPEKIPDEMLIKWIKPSIQQRLKAEWWLAKNVKPGDVVLCFGNLPPLFKLRGHVMVFVQNRYLVDNVGLKGFPVPIRFRISIERLWCFWKAKHAHEFIVQTPSMKWLLQSLFGKSASVHVMPFVSFREGYSRRLNHHDV